MPEAPEVQAICNSLSSLLQGKKICKAWMDHPKLAGKPGIDNFCKALEGEHFQGFERYGKYLIFEMDSVQWVCHLKMEGKFLLFDPRQLETINLSGLPIEIEELQELQELANKDADNKEKPEKPQELKQPEAKEAEAAKKKVDGNTSKPEPDPGFGQDNDKPGRDDESQIESPFSSPELSHPIFSHPFLARHCHAKFLLDSGEILCYVDTRKFGRMYLRKKEQSEKSEEKEIEELKEREKRENESDSETETGQGKELEVQIDIELQAGSTNTKPQANKEQAKAKKKETFVLDKLGKDVLDPTLSADYLYQKLHKRKIPIKTALLDQSVIAGIGNIYANEILFQAGIHPLQPCKELSLKQYEKLISLLQSLMKAAMEEGGTTIKSFSHPGGVGHFQSHLLIYQKELCPICQTPIEKIQIGQRSAYLCPNCQKLQPSPDRSGPEKAPC